MKHSGSKKLLLIATVFLFTEIHAQQKEIPPAADRAAKLTDWMKTNLQLTDEQVPKAQDINLKYANKTDELRNSTASKRQKLKTLKANDAAKDNELKAVFTDEQFKTYQSKKDEIKKKFKEKMKARKHAA